jgi:rSAM/selenodomain-associated transferase 1
MRALALFAKNPEAMLAKTRLVPPLTFVQAATLAAAFLEDSSATVAALARQVDAKPCVFYDPPSALNAMRPLLREDFATYPQAQGDLGQRLKLAYMQLADEGYSTVCFVGTDSPTLPHTYVERAFQALNDGCDTALGPALDGGYYLIGLRAAHLGLFDDVDWSSERVFRQTLARAEQLGLSVEVLDEWYDVDDLVGLERLCRDLLEKEPDAAHTIAPRTTAVLTALFASDRTRDIKFT